MVRAKSKIGEFVLPVQVQMLREGGFLAICDVIQGCHAEGKTLPHALKNLQDVAKTLLELRLEDGLGMPEGLRLARANRLLRGEILVSV